MIQSHFNKVDIDNLQFALAKEYLQTTVTGAYTASALAGCNTRKYHALLAAHQPQIDDDCHVLLSLLHEKILYRTQSFNLATQQYPNVIFPEGYKYCTEFSIDPIPKWIFEFDDCTVSKELLLPPENTVYVRYTVLNARDKLEMSILPFLAFRNMHQLSKANLYVNKKIKPAENGIKLKLYPEYDDLYLQLSHTADFIAAPDWYYNVEYAEEQKRGYDFHEDLYVPGQFNLKLKKGDQFVFSASLEEGSSKAFKSRFSKLLKKKQTPETLTECLTDASRQFIIKSEGKIEIKAGYYWFGRWGRDSFISLPGLTLVTGHPKIFKSVIEDILPSLKGGLFPNAGKGKNAAYNSADAPLWFIWAMQQYALHMNNLLDIWNEYGRALASILDNYKKGTKHNIKMDADYLITQGDEGIALTWMDAIVDGKPVTPRRGKTVEINALWYNALCFCLEGAHAANDNEFINKWQTYPDSIKRSFNNSFWNEEKGYLADVVSAEGKDWSFRPNQVIALAMPFSPVDTGKFIPILEKVKNILLTPRGLRTLSPADPDYHGIYFGDQPKRDEAYHQGIVWPWLIGPFAEAYLKTYGEQGIKYIQDLYNGFENALLEGCLYTISELYNGEPPHAALGAVSQAWSVAELLRVHYLLKKYKKEASTLLIEENK